MSEGFNSNIKVNISGDEVSKLLKKYKRIKKYMKSSLFAVKSIDGTEKVVSELLDEYNQDPMT